MKIQHPFSLVLLKTLLSLTLFPLVVINTYAQGLTGATVTLVEVDNQTETVIEGDDPIEGEFIIDENISYDVDATQIIFSFRNSNSVEIPINFTFTGGTVTGITSITVNSSESSVDVSAVTASVASSGIGVTINTGTASVMGTTYAQIVFDLVVEGAVVPSSAEIAASVFLEGAYNGTDLNTTINSSIPSAQPYSGSAFNNHTGTESASAPAGAVDWVLVELREAASAATALNSTKVGSAAGFLMSDGSIKASDGTSNLAVSLSGNSGADFFVVIYHRNHFPIMSASAISESSGSYSIDFTSSAANTHQTTTALVSLTGGKFGLPAGDTDGNGSIDATDLSTWTTNNGLIFSYNTNGVADFNLDGVINAVDRNDFQKKNVSKTSQVPTT